MQLLYFLAFFFSSLLFFREQYSYTSECTSEANHNVTSASLML